MPRMRILNASEQARLSLPPVFDSSERKQFFDFPKSLFDIAAKMNSSVNQIGFLLMCGYFRATKDFFQPQNFHSRDIAYAAGLMNIVPDEFQPQIYKETTRLRHQKIILNFFGYRPFDASAEAILGVEVATMARAHLKPRLIFGRCLDLMIQNRIQTPGVRQLADIISKHLNTRKHELAALMKEHLSSLTRQKLDALFTSDEGSSRYRLTLLKKQSQSTKPGKIKQSVVDFGVICELYQDVEPVLGMLGLGPDGVRYYAGSVLKSEIFQLQRRADADRYIHVIAFIAHQHHRLHDALADVLLSVVRSIQNAAQREHKDKVYEQRQTHGEQINTLLTSLDNDVVGALRQIRGAVNDDDLSDAQKLHRIEAVLAKDPAHQFETIKAHLNDKGADDGEYYRVLENQSLRLQARLNSILKVLIVQGNTNSSTLIAAIEHFRNKDGVIGKGAPLGFLDPQERKAVGGDNGTGFRSSLYKAFLFLHVANAIKAGNLNLVGSYKYRPLDDYLIGKEQWRLERAGLLARAGLESFANPEPVLRELESKLQQQYEITNNNAKEGRNAHLKILKNGKFHVATPALEPSDANALQGNFPQRHIIPLPEVLATVNQHCHMLDELQHWHQNQARPSAPAILLAGIMGLGCGIGIQKMARISSSISERELEHAVNWRFSLDNIMTANDRVVETMDQMELPDIYRKSPDRLHTASDGQKFEVRAESLNANYSFKYFGKGQGVSAYSFIDERNLLWHSLVFSAADRESAYVIDGLMHNDVIKSDIHSTDTHGYTEAIFGTTYPLGFSYAPRIKNLKKQTLYHFRARKGERSADWVIAPTKHVDEAHIVQNWDEFLRLLVTIKLKVASASDIFRRLNSYSRQHSLYKTMKAFGQIIKSLFILRYIDDLELRQAIEKVLNKVELTNKFTRAVAVGNPREFAQAEKEEQEIAEACNRLIKNSIICWNYLYLDRKLAQIESPESRQQLLLSIAAQSPVAWTHINMLGEYDFSEDKLRDTLGILPPK